MSQENQITLRGYLTAEPKLYQKTPQAVPLTELRVGCTPRRLNHETGEWQDLPTSYFKIKCWRRLAINAVSSLHKGDQVLVRGRFYMNTWVDSQQRPRSALEIEADTLGHDLAYGWSHYLRGMRPAGDSAAAGQGEAERQDTEAPAAGDRDDDCPPGPEGAGPEDFSPRDAGLESPGEPGGPGEPAALVEPGEDEAVDPPEWQAAGGSGNLDGAAGVQAVAGLPDREPVPF